ncbi:MAG: hypothetical protein DK303_000834 [Chloroflexi bacterium]|jgi:hypothetical protein|nr:MAG: hypothetical protein DK303_000834 [Chloroflexota bacterium]
MRINGVRNDLLSGKPAKGPFVGLQSPNVAELMGTLLMCLTGFKIGRIFLGFPDRIYGGDTRIGFFQFGTPRIGRYD